MRELRVTTRFKRDIKRAWRRGKDATKVQTIVEKLVAGRQLEQRYRAHHLIGDSARLMECHIEPDWLLIWQEDEQTVTLVGTGTHADLFE